MVRACDNVRVRELFLVADPSFEPAYDLYVRTFPENEREPRESIERRLDPLRISRPNQECITHFLVAERGEKVVGMRIHDFYPKAGLGWLIYLAVDPAEQSMGIGSHLLKCGVASLKLDALYNGVTFRGAVLEVERVQDAKDDAEREQRTRRIRFFEKHKAELLTDAYVQPALAEGLEPVPLNLFLIGAPSLPTTQEKEQLIRSFYVDLWGFAEDDPEIDKALAGIPA